MAEMQAGDGFYGEFAKMTGAGLSLRQSLRAMLDSQPPARQRQILAILAREVEAGRPFSQGLAAAGLPGLDRAIIAAGERGGRLPQAFAHLAGYYDLLARARRDALHALLYPVVMLHLGLLAGNLPLAFMRGKGVAAALRDSLPELGILWGAGLLLWLAWGVVARAAQGNAALDAAVNAIPLLGKTRRALAMNRFTKVWHIALLAGISLRETITMAAEASRSGMIRMAAGGLHAALDRGEPLGPPMARSGAFPNAFARAYTTAEQAGTMDSDLERWARVFEDEAVAGVKLLSALVPKIIYLLALAYVGWKIVGFWSGYYETIYDQLETGE